MPAKPNEIKITRVYDAPVKLVWEAWTDLNQISKWWGPRGFTLTTKSKELRPGGKWIYTMHGPDGTDYPNIATYHEVLEYEKLVYDHGGNEERDKLFSVSVTFEEHSGQTTMKMTMTLPTAEAAEQTKQFIKSANGNSTWDRLGEYLTGEELERETFIINRSFNGDIETVFQMWSHPEHLAKWLPPTGSQMVYLTVNAKEGGTSLWSMNDSDGNSMHGQLTYRQITPPSILVYTQNFSDQAGNLVKPSFSPSYPDRILTTVTFATEEELQTRVTLKWTIFGEATALERKSFTDMKPHMTGGWSGSFDKLDAVLASKTEGS